MVRSWLSNAVAMAMIIVAAALILVACQRKPVMAHARFIHLPSNGWQSRTPLTFKTQYDDSTATYDLSLAVRHDVTYAYRSLSLVVDIIAADATMTRKTVNIPLADGYGNWTGGGFGALYQDTISIADGISPDKAHSLVVWQAMEGCDTLCGVVDIGVIARPN